MSGKFAERQERNRTRREKLAGYFFDISKLIFAGLVIGGLTPLLTEDYGSMSWAVIVSGGGGDLHIRGICKQNFKTGTI